MTSQAEARVSRASLVTVHRGRKHQTTGYVDYTVHILKYIVHTHSTQTDYTLLHSINAYSWLHELLLALQIPFVGQVRMSSSRRNQQTRLNLTPLPSSSPVPSGLPEQIQARAANVRYDSSGSPTKKRRVDLRVSGQSKLNFQGNAQQYADLPTPEPSSQAEVLPEQGQ